jgi:D-alanyl-D-alanine carboxypeptidase/D-alanyl-D-alanine-endopeptidase (penicillin-binding protein 4)
MSLRRPKLRLEPELGGAPALPIAAPRMVADLWAEAGGSLRGHVVERDVAAARPRAARWSSELLTPVGEVPARDEQDQQQRGRAPRAAVARTRRRRRRHRRPEGRHAQGGAGAHARLASHQGLHDGDITVVLGSGQSRAERGKPRALVDLLRNAWRGADSQTLVDSLPIAGVDGTLIHRMTSGAATGQAYLKTGTLSDTRASPATCAPRSGPRLRGVDDRHRPGGGEGNAGLDSLVEWVARAG